MLHDLADNAETEYLTAEEIQKLWQLKGHQPAPWELRALQRGGVFPLCAGAVVRRLKLSVTIGPCTRFSLMSALIDETDDPNDFAEKSYAYANDRHARDGLRRCFELLNGPVGNSGRSLIDL